MALSSHLYDANENARKHNIICYLGTANSHKNKFKSIKFNASDVYSEVNRHHLIASQEPATTIEFALKLLSYSTDDRKAEEIRKSDLRNTSSSCSSFFGIMYQ
ncbi:unnamed protein product [Rotaria sp. Silwood2]|nr:unnamed protein product [Rotaria sp. Silwood2]CAF2853659.1 unnamed protein product [Rotaria sp. Silwood2]CAF3139447.1 unnamed protein product [Rotaria sp. Silwood2]CAF4248190.1 unnamed protein product [Rotaria sp. Silwood2]CAF4405482.1 unnamed protein product [Rotaria sp. Silwood2]